MKGFTVKHKEDFDLLCESFSPRLLTLSQETNDLYVQTIVNIINIILKKDKEKGIYIFI